jgi:cell division protein FtsL
VKQKQTVKEMTNRLDLTNLIRMIMSTTICQMMCMYLNLLMTAKSVVLRGFNTRRKVFVVVMGR